MDMYTLTDTQFPYRNQLNVSLDKGKHAFQPECVLRKKLNHAYLSQLSRAHSKTGPRKLRRYV